MRSGFGSSHGRGMKIVNGKDFWAGVMFAGIGIGFMVASRAYPMGTSVRMGPAYFPMVLGGLLALLGLIVLLRGFISRIEHGARVFPFRFPLIVAAAVIGAISYAGADAFKEMGAVAKLVPAVLNAATLFLVIAAFGPRPLFVILASVVVFGYALKPLGLVLAAALLIFGSAWGGHEFRFREVAMLYAGLAAFAVAAFVYGLGLPMNIWPNLG